jgi:hypothetical protein
MGEYDRHLSDEKEAELRKRMEAAENYFNKPAGEPVSRTIEIEVDEVLHQHNSRLNWALVRDTSGKEWVLPFDMSTSESRLSYPPLKRGIRLKLAVITTPAVYNQTKFSFL